MDDKKMEVLEYLNQARYFVGAEQYEDALESINKGINIDKMSIELYIEKGIVLANMDKYDEAIVEFKNALKIDKTFAEAYFHIGNIQIMQNDKTHGIENYNKAIAHGYEDAQIYFNLGLMYEEDGDYELAIRNYTKAIISNPLRADARIRKANIYILHEKYPEALETLNELILSDPDLYEGYHLKNLLLVEMGKTDEAIKVIDEAIELFPKDPAFYIDKINLYVMSNEIEKAREVIGLLLNDFDLDLLQKRQIELEKSRIYALNGDIENIETALIKAKKYTSEYDNNDIDPEATFLLVNCALEMKKYDDAIKYSKELIDCDELQYSIPSYYTLPYSYLQKGDTEKASEIFKDSISKLRAITLENPEIADGYFFRTLCLKEIGEYDKAIELCNYLLKVDSSSNQFHSLKAEILNAAGREEEALQEKRVAESLS